MYNVINVAKCGCVAGDLSMLKPIMCGGFHLEVAVIWFSSGNTKSVLHTDSVENINCIFDGDKDIVFVDKVCVVRKRACLMPCCLDRKLFLPTNIAVYEAHNLVNLLFKIH